MLDSSAGQVGDAPRRLSLSARIPLTYLLIWIPAIFVAGVVTVGIIMTSNGLGLRFSGMGIVVPYLLNILPPFMTGVFWYRVAARRIRERAPPEPGIPGHLWRAAPLYLLAAILAAYVTWGAMNSTDGSFWLFAQFVIWPLIATVGGIVGDALEWRST